MENGLSNKEFRKWGWGWIVLAGLLNIGLTKSYPSNSTSSSIIYLSGIIFSILAYFYFRNKIFKNYNKYILRSFYSGLISYILSIAFIAVVASFVNIMTTDILISISQKIKYETDEISSTISNFQKEDALLWDFFVDEPSTDNEIKNNIKIIEKSVPLYNTKDSIALLTFNKIHKIIAEAEIQNPEKMSVFPITSQMMSLLISRYKDFSESVQVKFETLKNYYNSVLEDNSETDNRWDLYVLALNQLEESEKNYKIILNDFINAQKDFNTKNNL